MMRELSREDERWLALGKLWDLKNSLNKWKHYREEKYDQYKRAERSGANKAILAVIDLEIREIVDKVAELADEYEAQLNYVRKKGWL